MSETLTLPPPSPSPSQTIYLEAAKPLRPPTAKSKLLPNSRGASASSTEGAEAPQASTQLEPSSPPDGRSKRKQKVKQSKSRNGCITCKAKRFKCDETHPACLRCTKRGVECGGYKKDFKWKPVEEQVLSLKQGHVRARNASMSQPTLTNKPLGTRGSDKKRLKPHSAPIKAFETQGREKFRKSLETSSTQDGNSQKPEASVVNPTSPESSPSLDVPLTQDHISPRSSDMSQPLGGFDHSPSDDFRDNPLDPVLSSDVPPHDDSLLHIVDDGHSPTLSSILLPEPDLHTALMLDNVPSLEHVDVNERSPDETHGASEDAEYDPGLIRHDLPETDDSLLATETFSDVRHDATAFGGFGEMVDVFDDWTFEDLAEPVEDVQTFDMDTHHLEDEMALSADPLKRMFKEPQLDIGSPEMLMKRFLEHTCGIMSLRDTPSENPWRSLIWPMLPEHPVLFHAIASMACFHASKHIPALRLRGMQHVQESIAHLQTYRSQTDAVKSDAALATTMALAFSESWDKSKVATGINYIKITKSLLHRTVEQCRIKPRAGKDLQRLKFLCKTYIYLDVICRLTSVYDDVSNDVENVSALLSAPLEAETEIDPLMGCASTLFPVIGRVANLVRTVYRSKVNTPAVITLAGDLKKLLENWVAQGYYSTPADPTLTVQDSLQTAEAYRWATLLHLHNAVPEIPSLSSAELASRALRCLATVPITSRAVIVHIYPLLVAGCEAADEETRQWVRDRWQGMSQRMAIGNIDRCADVVAEVWQRRDEHEAKEDLGGMLSNGSCIISRHGCSINGVTSLDGFPHWTDPFPSNDRNAVFEELFRSQRAGPLRSNLKVSSSLTEDIDPAYTVRGKLHWMAVMMDWRWEVFLG